MPSFTRSRELFERACRVTPGGIYGHAAPANAVPGRTPYYAERGRGCRYWDVDGNEYIDFLCAYGPVVLGHGDPEVEAAAERERRAGSCFNHPTPRMVELAEYLVAQVDFADWALFGKNGSDMINWAVRVAREHTGRRKLLGVSGAYHGMGPLCAPAHGGLIDADRAHVHEFAWNDLEGFDELVRRHGEDTAALVLTPYHHPGYAGSVLPAEGFLQALQRTCNERGIVVILDDIRAGFRLDLGGSHRAFGFEPDIACYCKALANGHPIAAALGRAALRVSASRVFVTGTYWYAPAPMAAALACLGKLERERVPEHLAAMGRRLTQGLEARARAHDLEVACSGPPALPFMTFAEPLGAHKMQAFSAAAAAHGAFFHPHHNWFLCAAHTEADIDAALVAADAAFQSVAEEFTP